MHNGQTRRPVTTVTDRRQRDLVPIPAAVFLEPVYADGRPYEDPADDRDEQESEQ